MSNAMNVIEQIPLRNAACIGRHSIFAVCEVMEQGLLSSPIAAYSDIEHARSVAARNSNDQYEFAVVKIPFFMEMGAFSE